MTLLFAHVFLTAVELVVCKRVRSEHLFDITVALQTLLVGLLAGCLFALSLLGTSLILCRFIVKCDRFCD